MWRNWNPHTLLSNCNSTVENSLATSQMIKQKVTIQLSNSTLRNILKKNENIYTHKNLYINNTIHNIQRSKKKNPNVHLLING